ncbi:lysylphosphatidylglycerol synthase transmembrane domain-containing protein [Fundidesulfovibrio agrisoli]|uniref:lysylphosphatidylglycerol synthase transmembrane domain-containing protein n=1 Tax=Fundidesulfovibrio agrisoli TaxID=2922717 RepID=UPI001FAC1FE6|nr:lysylphosphatidylglycerol synthase transmembrane domain-containing protein [Fundidesulfovibrio agrisoli]
MKFASLFPLLKRHLGLIVSLALLAWVLHIVGLEAIVAGFKSLSPGWSAALLGVYALGLGLRAVRWSRLLQPVLSVPVVASAHIILVGNLANNILPAKAGDVARALLLKRLRGVALSAGIMSVLIERIFDVLALLLIFLLAVLSVRVAPGYQGVALSILLTASAVFLGALAVLLAIKTVPGVTGLLLSLAGKLPAGPGAKLTGLIGSLRDSLAFVRLDAGFAWFTGLGLAVWLAEGLAFWVGFKAFQVPGGVMEALLVFALVNFSALLPAAPGNIGVYQASVVFAFTMLGLPLEPAVPMSLVLQLAQMLFNSALGVLSMRALGLDGSFLRLAGAERRER